ncbi:MAG TPA: sodium:calcium antiporter, partial [Dehalococcoidia bacterium]|nr:sodium:calcium antiporter [Dehalococcoidia bacterium]
LGTTFVGSLFLAAATSMPELVVVLAAMRLGAYDMAVSNMVGSNLFNMGVIVFADDLFYVKGPVLSHVSETHVFSALAAAMMTCMLMVGLIFRTHRWSRAWASLDSVILIISVTAQTCGEVSS